MTGSIGLAEAKWTRKMSTAGAKWKADVTGKGSAYCSGVAAFLGTGTCNPEKESAWNTGVDAVSAADFQASVAGKGPKWAARYREAMSP